MLDSLREKANNLPLLPGVYIMLDEHGEVIYVGKAKKLKNRVSSYFHGEHLPKVEAMVEKVHDFNVIVAGSEFEALVLENSLIKQHKPHYNILLKDDKGYPFIRLDLHEEYPKMTLTNRAGKDGAKYFGPFGGRSATFDIIRTLNPKPGAAYGAETPGYITPDVIVRRQGSGYRVELNDEGVPQLRISKLYQHAEGLDSETQAYISGRFRAALWLLKSIESRRTTIRRVVEEIVRRQRACIEQGPAALVPMTMQEVADAIGVHESTVSRAAAGKYVELPRGIVPMKSFFTANLAAGGEAAYGAATVKRALAALIEGEDPAKPLSDAKLAKLLAEQGCPVSRRTVVKYREQLGIASSVKRKRY